MLVLKYSNLEAENYVTGLYIKQEIIIHGTKQTKLHVSILQTLD